MTDLRITGEGELPKGGKNKPTNLVEELVALGERASHLTDTFLQKRVHPELVNAVSEVATAAKGLAAIVARDTDVPLPGGIDITPRIFTTKELEVWVNRAANSIPAGPPGQTFGWRRLVLVLDVLHAMLLPIEKAVMSGKRVLDAAGDVAAPDVVTPRLVRTREGESS